MSEKGTYSDARCATCGSPETLAERYRRIRPRSWASLEQWGEFLLQLDGHSRVRGTDLGPVVEFSDGSIHRIGDK